MTFSWTWTNNLDDNISPEWGNEVHSAVKQLADDIYITPTNNGSTILPYPLQKLAPVYTGHVSGNGTAGVSVSLPSGFSPASIDDYEVIPGWQEDPGGNGQPWAEKGLSSFIIKHYGTITGKKIGYTIIRKTA